MYVSLDPPILSKDNIDEESSIKASKDKRTDASLDPSNWNFDIMAEDTFTNKIYETMTFK